MTPHYPGTPEKQPDFVPPMSLAQELDDRSVSPPIAKFIRAWCFDLSAPEIASFFDGVRETFLGTSGNEALEQRRGLLVADWLTREACPAWLRIAGITQHADALAALPEITDLDQKPAIEPTLRRAHLAAGAIVSSLHPFPDDAPLSLNPDEPVKYEPKSTEETVLSDAWYTCRSVAFGACGSSAVNAANFGAWYASDPESAPRWQNFWSLAGAAAWDAAHAHAWAVAPFDEPGAWAALTPTRAAVQVSAARLVKRMIAAR